MLKADKLPSGNYRVRVYRSGVSKSFTASTKKEATAKAMKWLNDFKNVADSNITLGEAMDLYVERKRNILSPVSILSYNGIKRLYFGDIKKFKLDMVTSALVQKEINKMAVSLSPKTVANAFGFLQASVQMFMPDKSFHISLPKRQKLEYATPNNDELKLLLDNCIDIRLKNAILLSAFGGLRRGEIAALTPDDINGNIISVNKDMVRDEYSGWIIKPPKTYSSTRKVAVPAFVIKSIQDNMQDDKCVALKPNQITDRFCTLRDSVGLKTRFHDLRHYYASIMSVVGIPTRYAMDFGGWSSPEVLNNVYTNVLDQEKKKFESMLNDYFSNLFSK